MVFKSTVMQWDPPNNNLLIKKENKVTIDLEGRMCDRI